LERGENPFTTKRGEADSRAEPGATGASKLLRPENYVEGLERSDTAKIKRRLHAAFEIAEILIELRERERFLPANPSCLWSQ